MRITHNGNAVSRITLGQNATCLEVHTAQEFRDYIEKLNGAQLLITQEQDACPMQGGKILIGRPSTHRMIQE